MSRGARGARNPNWKGGRVVDPRGYVLLRRPDHPAADVRGYVYEHRVVLEEMLGRPLARAEEVHHRNHDRSDNRPENLALMASRAHHAAAHRKRADLRALDEENPEIECACGCGVLLRRYDATNRPRRYVSGHNLRR